MYKYLNNFYNYKIFVEINSIMNPFTLFLCHQTKRNRGCKLWGDEIFGRQAPLSRG